MAYFAKLDENNIVMEVHPVHNNELLDENGNEVEQKGIDFLIAWSGGYTNWKQVSYNTYGGVHVLGGIPLRKNYPDVGYTYDATRDAFIPPKPFASWVLNESTCVWDPPITRPQHEDPEIQKMYKYIWDEEKWNTENNGWLTYYWDNDNFKFNLI